MIQDDLKELYERHARNKTHPSITECSDVLRDTLGRFFGVFFVIDDLDECRDATWRIMLSQVRDVQHRISTFITSRHPHSLEQHLTDAICIEIKPNDDDIKTYLEQQLTNWESLKCHLKKDPCLQHTIVDIIVTKARGIFS